MLACVSPLDSILGGVVWAIITPWPLSSKGFGGLQRVLQTGGAHAQNGAASKLIPHMQAPLGLDFFGPTIFWCYCPCWRSCWGCSYKDNCALHYYKDNCALHYYKDNCALHCYPDIPRECPPDLPKEKWLAGVNEVKHVINSTLVLSYFRFQKLAGWSLMWQRWRLRNQYPHLKMELQEH
jgi:hypothetical protein